MGGNVSITSLSVVTLTVKLIRGWHRYRLFRRLRFRVWPGVKWHQLARAIRLCVPIVLRFTRRACRDVPLERLFLKGRHQGGVPPASGDDGTLQG
jgi:hypothetical protein